MESEATSMLMKKDLLYQKIKDAINKGQYSIGHRFRPESEFAKDLGVARNTLRAVFNRLESEKLIKRIKHKGTFVSGPGKVLKRFLILHDSYSGQYNPHYHIIPGIERTALTMGFDIEICLVQSITELEYHEVTEILKLREISGIIIISAYFIGNEKIIHLLNGQNIPIVLTHAYRKDYHVTSWATITYNAQGAWQEALQHLRNMGHKRIMTLAHKTSENKIRGYSHKEYDAMLKNIGADNDSNLIYCMAFNEIEIEKAVRNVFNNTIPPTAIICHSDFWAASVYKTLKSMGLRIPADVAVMGFCGSPDGEYMNPPLSTIDLNYFNIGKTAVELLATANEWFYPEASTKTAPPLVFTPYQLKSRKSTDMKIFEHKYNQVFGGNL